MNDNIYDKLNNLADEVGCAELKAGYNEIHSALEQGTLKQYAVLGDVNSGKSSLINILEEEKKLPVSMRTGEHEKQVCVESDKHGCKWVELSADCYTAEGMDDIDSPLWHIDAAVYIISATTPLSQQDMTAIGACVTHGVPCTLILSKLDMIDEEERDEVISYVKAQAERHFGCDELIIMDIKDAEGTRQRLIGEFTSSEESRDIRDYMLAISYARALKEAVSVKYAAAKERAQAVSDKEKKAKQTLVNEKLEWERIELELDTRKLALIEKMTAKMNRLYAECIDNLSQKAMLAGSAKDWWKQSLEGEFHKELSNISYKIGREICFEAAKDRSWLIQSVEERFDTSLHIGAAVSEPRLEDSGFGAVPERLKRRGMTMNMAMTGMVISTAALCGALIFPGLMVYGVGWKLAAGALAGTGVWTYVEAQRDKEEKLRCLKTEIAKAVLANKDENIKILKNNIVYGYDSMNQSVKELQLAAAKSPESPEDKEAMEEFRIISRLNRKCDELVGSLLTEEEE